MERRRPFRVATFVLGWLVLGVSGFVAWLRYLDADNRLMMIAAGASYAVVGFVVSLLLLLAGLGLRRRFVAVIGVMLAIGGCVVTAVPVARLFVGNAPTGPTALTILTSNVEVGGGSARALVAAARSNHVDILAVEEATPSTVAQLRAAGIEKLLPNLAGHPDPDGVNGVLVYSKVPLVDVRPVLLGHGGWQIRVGGAAPFIFIAVHADAPLTNVERWRADLATIASTIKAAHASGPVVVAGDFNATPDHAPFRRMLTRGAVADAAAQAKSGWQPTWPTWFVPLITLDHVLTTREYAATHTRSISIPGTDHRALLATLTRR